MNSVAVKFICRHGSKSWRPATNNGIRMGSSDEKCSPNKAEPSSPTATTKICPQPPPCASMPSSPQGSSSTPPGSCTSDPNNPCNYVPPKCKDPNYPNMTKLKRLQCKFQENNDLPIYLKKGTSDVILYHTSIILTGFSLLLSFYSLYKQATK